MRKEDQSRVLSAVRGRVIERIVAETAPDELGRVVRDSLDAERQRLQSSPLSLRGLQDRAFWLGVGWRLRLGGPGASDDALWAIVSHYAEEICGDFDPVAYEVAVRLLPPALRVLLSPSQLADLPSRLLEDRHDRIVLEGALDALRALPDDTTLVFAPTHHSNLDSIVLGLALHRLGIPPVIYGAGINLLGNPVMGLFMHNFGAYTVDRQKTDPLYRATLKEYVVVTLEHGYHHLFYPGGTRSRSGALEDKLKLGLLGASADAQHRLLESDSSRRVRVIPVTLSYELVPEAETLAGSDDASGTSFTEFAQRLLSLDSQIHLVFGEPLDVDGTRPPHAEREPLLTLLREAPRTATQRLGEQLVAAYRRDNLLQATHVAAHALRSLLQAGERTVPRESVEKALGELLARLRGLERRGVVRVLPALEDAHTTLLAADTAFASYHRRRALVVEAATVHTEDARLLDFYANRLAGYAHL